MIKALSIKGFRAFEDFSLTELGRVNLLVGNNNSGKTSILEAIQLYASDGSPLPVRSIAGRRGEMHMDTSDGNGRSPRKYDVAHLFHGHQVDMGDEFSITAETETGTVHFRAEVVEREEEESEKRNEIATEPDLDELESDLALRLSWDNAEKDVKFALGVKGDISSASLPHYRRHKSGEPTNVKSVFTGGISVRNVVNMFDSVVLTPEEERVTQALQTIEPKVERLAAISSEKSDRSAERGGIVVRCKGVDERIPIGSMGDGMWRMLGLALSLVSAKGGILLVDEIDTGLHFTVMEEMWKLVYETSCRLGIQVFATTHSRDAVDSLATTARICESGEVTIQRIDSHKHESERFEKNEIIAAEKHGTELR